MANGKSEESTIITPSFTQFKDKPKAAIRHLKRVKKGECVKVFKHPVIGYIDIVWGEVTDPVKHKGYGLAHIIDKHGGEMKELGCEVEDFIPIIMQFGNLRTSKTGDEYLLESETLRIVIEKKYRGVRKNWVLTSFDLRTNKGRNK